MYSGRWAEAAHLFRPNLTPNSELEDVVVLNVTMPAASTLESSPRLEGAFAPATAERVFTHR
eukprot:5426136-Prymnesium_polylepis.1